MPPDPPSLACKCINCIHIRPPPCNPSSKNPGYGPASNMARCFNIYHRSSTKQDYSGYINTCTKILFVSSATISLRPCSSSVVTVPLTSGPTVGCIRGFCKEEKPILDTMLTLTAKKSTATCTFTPQYPLSFSDVKACICLYTI